jgi:hypothetical protein
MAPHARLATRVALPGIAEGGLRQMEGFAASQARLPIPERLDDDRPEALVAPLLIGALGIDRLDDDRLRIVAL